MFCNLNMQFSEVPAHEQFRTSPALTCANTWGFGVCAVLYKKNSEVDLMLGWVFLFTVGLFVCGVGISSRGVVFPFCGVGFPFMRLGFLYLWYVFFLWGGVFYSWGRFSSGVVFLFVG